jgi:hypothetical protein
VIIERVFSPPADHQMEWRWRVRNIDSVVTVEAADAFARFLEAVTGSIVGGDHERFHRDLLSDAECRAQISKALSNQKPPRQPV